MHLSKSLRIIVLIFLTVASGQLRASDNAWSQMLIIGNFDIESSESRAIIARNLLINVSSINEYIPSLRDSEIKWLNDEYNSMDSLSGEAASQKIYMLTSSPEYSQDQIKKALANLQTALSCIVNAGEKIDAEMYCWAYVNLIMSDENTFNEAIVRLHNSSKVRFPDDLKKQFHLSVYGDTPWLVYGMFARSIQKNIVMRYLELKIN